MNRIALGRGLEALIPTAPPSAPAASGPAKNADVINVPLGVLIANPHQPRSQRDEARFQELVASIRAHGVLQPVIVKSLSGAAGGGFQIIAGERRCAAAREAGLLSVPAILADQVTPSQEIEWALIENLQREDLNCLDEASGYEKLARLFGYTQDQIAEKVGKDRSTVANTLRLLTLPDVVNEKVASGKLSAGHARALLALPQAHEQIRLANRAVAENLSVRRLEEIVYGRPKRILSRAKKRSPELEAVERQLRLKLGATVHIAESGKRGRIIIDYYGHDDLNRILGIVGAA